MRPFSPIGSLVGLLCFLSQSSAFAFTVATRTHPSVSLDSTRSLSRSVPASSLHLSLSSLENDFAANAFAGDKVNGDCSGFNDPFEKLEELNVTIDDLSIFPSAPQLSFNKFVTMQDKRVVVTIRYSGEAGLKPFFLTVAKKVKYTHPDVIVERKILSAVDDEQGEATFEVLVDGKVVIGKGKSRKQKVARVDMARARSVFVSMQELELAISRARKKKRPSSSYGEEEDTPASRRGVLRESSDKSNDSSND